MTAWKPGHGNGEEWVRRIGAGGRFGNAREGIGGVEEGIGGVGGEIGGVGWGIGGAERGANGSGG